MKKAVLIVLALNEVNFDVVAHYAKHQHLRGFQKLMSSFSFVETFAEDKFMELEPWIQWVSLHTGKRYHEHGVFRLGDIVQSDIPQIFEVLEGKGLSIGAVSPMNARNNLQRPAYFIPDPWTETSHDGSAFSARLTDMLRQTVNDNARKKISLRSTFTLLETAIRTLSTGLTPRLIRLVLKAQGRPWLRALVLDQILHMIHLHLLRKKAPDVSFVFLNAGAHIQHHYYLCSPHSGVESKNPDWYVSPQTDPILDMLRFYDQVLQDYFSSTDKLRLIVATGLSQVAYEKVKFYYRLVNHKSFLSSLGLRFSRVLPRMTRDFEVIFDSDFEAFECQRVLAALTMEIDGLVLFGDFEVRDKSLFVSLTYPREILKNCRVRHNAALIENFDKHVAFVAIKNGMHASKGFAYFSPGIDVSVPGAPIHVSELFTLISQAASHQMAPTSST